MHSTMAKTLPIFGMVASGESGHYGKGPLYM